MKRIVKLAAILRVPTFRSALLRHRVAAAVEHTRVLGDLDLRTVIDVGANRGQFSLFALQHFPGASIIAIEPLAGPAERFRRTFAGHDRVTLHQTALGPVGGEATMHVSGQDDSSSLLPITSTQSDMFKGTAEVRTEEVRVSTLPDLIDRASIQSPAMLKLDVQGFELEALRGCAEFLPDFAYVCAEGSFVELYEGQAKADDVIVWLREHGFHLICVYGTVSDDQGRAVQADMLFGRTHPAE
ncbi:FkbM family methyltransferase [Mycolicibacterium sediminis]|uniref:Methyltransferase FkbM domain-containing protein n=1 Tax=Mycolicibacterium sediminis TaxID=1286180 RepID=A0A7I7QQF3_9MYCO|nr:FkbM family methyltransferase [Mycolicibacterium sediminis]BBY28618.1 hypothetical protein MSEDJ_27140 [Mycolicibacterium sediminis]